MKRLQILVLAVVALVGSLSAAPAQNGLPSWKEGPSRDAIVRFVSDVTRVGGRDFVEPSERIAVFDNDGTLWAEQPAYFQLYFAIDRVKALAPHHPEWRERQPFKAAIEGDMAALAATGERGLIELVMATHSGMTPDEFKDIVSAWLKVAKHPRLGRRFDTLAYQPMLEVLDYLRANGFKTYIVSGGGIEFVRSFAERVYGVPPEQVVGSSIKTTFEMRDGKAVLLGQPTLDFIDDKAGKPVAINAHIGRRPIAAFGNSDGDFEMLQWTTEGSGRRLGMIIRHDDAEREYAYDRNSHVGRLSRALDEAQSRNWTVVSMKDDWSAMFAEGR